MPAYAWNGLLLALSLAAGLAVCEAALRLADTRYEQVAEPPLRKYLWPNTRAHPDTNTPHKLLFNSFGNRQHRDFSDHDLRNGVHVALFGDSFTEGRRVPVQYTFAEVLDHLLNAQAKTPSHAAGGAAGEARKAREPHEGRADAEALRVHVHNFGVEGTGPGNQYLRYRGFAHKDRLRHVFYMHYLNDFDNLRTAGLYFLSPTGDLVRRMRRPPSVWIRFLSGLRLTYLALDVWHRLAGTANAQPAKPVLDGDLVFEALLSRWRDEIEANGGAFHVVLLPPPGTAAQFHQRVESGLFDVFDMRDCFREEIPGYVWEDWRFKSDGHFNEAGHMVAAHCLYRFLESRMGLERASDEALARARHFYYRAFADDTDWQGQRFMPAAPWALPTPVDAAEAVRVRAKHLALERGGDDQRRRIVREVRQGELLARGGGWDVYASPRHRVVVYIKSPCEEGEGSGRLFMHAFPVNLGDLPDMEDLPPPERGFIRFPLDTASWREGGDCVVARYMGAFAFAKLHTGEYRERPGGDVLWDAEFPFPSAQRVAAVTAAYRREYDAFANAAPKARSDWNIHVRGRRLAFLKAPCDAGDLHGFFFLHMYPSDPSAAADELAPGGFAYRDMHFGTDVAGSALRLDSVHGLNGKCLLATTLPEWPVATISAGQKVEEAVLWETTFHLDVERFRRVWTAVRSKAPTARGDFDIHRRGAELIYVRESCAERNATARFFLHVFAGASHSNLDFDFKERGVVFDGRCVAVVRLPTEDIDRIHTGQFVAGEGTLWSVEI